MSTAGFPIILSDWYEMVADGELMQGDIFEDCPVFYPPIDLQWPLEANDEPEFTMEKGTMVIMSQSCDLQAEQKSDIPPFKSDKAEAEALRKLNALDEESRKRVIESFR